MDMEEDMRGLLILTFFLLLCNLIATVTLSGRVRDSRVRIQSLEKSISQLNKVKMMDQMEEIEYLTDLAEVIK